MSPDANDIPELQACSCCGMKVPKPVELHHSEADCLAEQKRQREGRQALDAVHEAHERLEAAGRLCDPSEQDARREQLRRACEGCTHALADHLTHRDHPDAPHPCTVEGCTCKDFVPEVRGETAGDRVEDLAGLRQVELDAIEALRAAAVTGVFPAELDTPDAQVWAAKFRDTFLLDLGAVGRGAAGLANDGRETFILDHGTLIGWFANALLCGRRAGLASSTPLPAEEVAQRIVDDTTIIAYAASALAAAGVTGASPLEVIAAGDLLIRERADGIAPQIHSGSLAHYLAGELGTADTHDLVGLEDRLGVALRAWWNR